MSMQEIRVGMYSPFFLPSHGGTEIATYNLAKHLIEFCNIQVYTFNWIPTSDKEKEYGLNLSCNFPKKETINGVCVYRYPVTNLPIVKNLSLKLAKDLDSSNIDILHCQGIYRLPSVWLLQRSLRKRKRILTAHALQEAIEIVKHSKCSFLLRSFFVNLLRNMDHIIALSTTDLRSLLYLGIPKNKITVIPNGIDTERFSKRKRFVERNERLKILCVARFTENKNHEPLIYALRKLRDNLDVEAYFIGAITDHEYFERIVKLIERQKLEKYVKIGLSLDDPSVIDCYLSCDLFVLPSIRETFPLTILEALYAGLPVVASRVGDIPDIVKDETNGFLVTPNDPKQLYERCLQVLKDEKIRNEIRNRNMEIAKNYAWSRIAASTYALYQQLA